MLSQYELLTLLCENLSSADIIHLGWTLKEHWLYIGHSPVICKGLLAESTCDGKGIVAQARVFGHYQADPAQALMHVKCRGRDAKPCRDCGAMVCNVRSSILTSERILMIDRRVGSTLRIPKKDQAPSKRPGIRIGTVKKRN